MSAPATRRRDRPIAEHQRPRALLLVALVLTGATLLLALTRPAPHHPPRATVDPPPRPQGTAPARSLSTQTRLLSRDAERAGRVFLAGYLAYIYGHAPVGWVHGATGALARSLHEHPRLASPAMRALDPRVVSLHNTSTPAGMLAVRALVNDGGLVDYPLELRLAHRREQLLVSGVG